jgi:hypothetical protein
MRGPGYVRLISWTHRRGSKHLGPGCFLQVSTCCNFSKWCCTFADLRKPKVSATRVWFNLSTKIFLSILAIIFLSSTTTLTSTKFAKWSQSHLPFLCNAKSNFLTILQTNYCVKRGLHILLT